MSKGQRHSESAVEKRYAAETSSVRGITLFLLALALGLLVIHIAVAGLFMLYRPDRAMPAAAGQRHDAKTVEAEPEVAHWVRQTEWLERVQRADRRQLRSFGWVNEDEGIAHLPIGEAIDLVSEKKVTIPGDRSGPLVETSPGAASDREQN